jgi:hypothetical protein
LLIPVAEGALLSVAGLPRKYPVIPAKVVIRGIAQVEAAEVGLGAEFAICKKDFAGVEGAMMRIERHVAGVADIRYSRAPDPHRLRQQGNLRQADLQGVGIHRNPAVREGVDQGRRLGHALRKAQVSGKNGCPVGGNDGAVVVSAGKSQVELRLVAKVRILVAERGHLLQRSVVGAQGNGLVGAAQIGAAYIEQNALAGPGNAVGIALVAVGDSQQASVPAGERQPCEGAPVCTSKPKP